MKRFTSGKTFSATLFIFILLSCCINVSAQNNNACSNVGFELGDFTNWNGAIGVCCPIVMTSSGFNIGIQHRIVTSSSVVQVWFSCPSASFNNPPYPCPDSCWVGIPGRDPNEGFPLVCPFNGGTYSTLLGNDNNGSHAESITYQYAVTNQNPSFSYNFAVVLQDPSHPVWAQPRFEILFTDSTGDTIPCGYLFVHAQTGIPGFRYDSCKGLAWKGWTHVTMDLTPYIGQTISARFSVGDCGLGAHFGYAYIDASCSPFQLQTNYNSCLNPSQITISAPTGYETYLWNTGDTTASIIVNNPVIGDTFSVIVQPLLLLGNCPSILSVILQPLSFQSYFTFLNACNGVVSFYDSSYTISGAQMPVSWSWNFGDTSSGSNNISSTQNPVHTFSHSGNFTVTLIGTSQSGCPDTFSSQVIIPSSISDSFSLSNFHGWNISCNGGTNGTATVYSFGGIPPFSYSWNTIPVQTGNIATALSAGTYTVTITDSAGCVFVDSISLNEPPALSDSITFSPAACLGNEGKAFVFVSGGTPNYSYSWSTTPTQTNDTATNLAVGNYTAQVTDLNGCMITGTVHVDGINLTNVVSSFTNMSCYGQNDGSISLAVSGGVTPYSFIWNPTVSSLSNAVNLSIGTYQVFVHNQNGCPDDSLTFSITQPDSLHIILNPDSSSCPEAHNGSITSLVYGGTAPYTYSWSNGQIIPGATNLLTGLYSLTVTDAHNCSLTHSTFVYPKPELVVDAGKDTTIKFNSSALLFATPDHIGQFGFEWMPGNNMNDSTIQNPVVTPIQTTTYQVLVIDADGCKAIDSVTVFVIPFIFIPNAFSPNGDDKNDFFRLINPAAVSKVDIKIFNRWGQMVFESNSPNFSWDGTFKNLPQEVDVYVWEINYVPINSNETIQARGNVSLVK